MSIEIHVQTVVLPGGRIEISTPELVPGQQATVTITIEDNKPAEPGHVIDILKSLPDHQLFQDAARLRAALGVKTPDALHAATAPVHHCDLFVTNDKGLRKIAELNITVLSELVGTTEPFRLVFVESTP